MLEYLILLALTLLIVTHGFLVKGCFQLHSIIPESSNHVASRSSLVQRFARFDGSVCAYAYHLPCSPLYAGVLRQHFGDVIEDVPEIVPNPAMLHSYLACVSPRPPRQFDVLRLIIPHGPPSAMALTLIYRVTPPPPRWRSRAMLVPPVLVTSLLSEQDVGELGEGFALLGTGPWH